jgi:hypothetical protein
MKKIKIQAFLVSLAFCGSGICSDTPDKPDDVPGCESIKSTYISGVREGYEKGGVHGAIFGGADKVIEKCIKPAFNQSESGTSNSSSGNNEDAPSEQ